MRITIVVGFLLAAPLCFGAEQTSIDLSRDSYSFSGECTKSPRCPDARLFADPVNYRIGNACIQGASHAELATLGISDLDNRLQKLVNANTLTVRDGKYYLGFPVLIGEKRDKTAVIVNRTAERIAPRVAEMLGQIRAAVPGHEEMVFHLLWSRVLDEVWCRAWQLEHRPGNCPPGVQWIVYPHQTFSVGTNTWSSDVAVTWGRHSFCNTKIVLDLRLELREAAWGQKPAADNLPALQRLGLLDAHGVFQGFAYHVDDPLDKLLNKLVDQYAWLVAGVYDYDRLSTSLDISSDELFVVLLHETAYALFDNLSHSGKLQIPPALNGAGETTGCRSLSSFLLAQVRSRDEIEYLFEKSGGRGDQKTIDACKEALKTDPNDKYALNFLGLSLYQMYEYRESLQVFRKLSNVTTSTPDTERHAISHLWMGHLYDLLGEREHAVHEYQEVLNSGGDTKINYSGYGISSTTARRWASECIKTPYVRQ